MSTQVASPPPLPELPRYFYASRSYKPKPICICDTPHEKTYTKPLIICRTRASKCPVKYYHAACVGEVARSLSDRTPWYCAHCMSDDVAPTRVCTCDGQCALSTPIVQCSRKAACGVRWYHRACVGALDDEKKWLCRVCVTEDREEEEEENKQQRQQQQAQQAQPQKLPQPEEDEDSKPPSRRIGQKQLKRQHRVEPEDEDHAAPTRKRVRFAPEPVSEEQIAPAGSHASSRESSPEQPEYCFCGQPSSNEMVACDGKKCDREWFHFACVGMTRRTVPKGKWYCHECSAEMKKVKRKGSKGKAGGKKRKR